LSERHRATLMVEGRCSSTRSPVTFGLKSRAG